eukprot:GHVT01099737.1.p1 GENE.GHVT01099737.1~~GHVT01099737.1.p1  ORF type:complete len:589 (-),score=143.67 GHVT01099737.1:173-1939(-)
MRRCIAGLVAAFAMSVIAAWRPATPVGGTGGVACEFPVCAGGRKDKNFNLLRRTIAVGSRWQRQRSNEAPNVGGVAQQRLRPLTPERPLCSRLRRQPATLVGASVAGATAADQRANKWPTVATPAVANCTSFLIGAPTRASPSSRSSISSGSCASFRSCSSSRPLTALRLPGAAPTPALCGERPPPSLHSAETLSFPGGSSIFTASRTGRSFWTHSPGRRFGLARPSAQPDASARAPFPLSALPLPPPSAPGAKTARAHGAPGWRRIPSLGGAAAAPVAAVCTRAVQAFTRFTRSGRWHGGNVYALAARIPTGLTMLRILLLPALFPLLYVRPSSHALAHLKDGDGAVGYKLQSVSVGSLSSLLGPSFLPACRGRGAAILFACLAATDALDGLLARGLGAESAVGRFLDPVADKVAVAACLAAVTERLGGGALAAVPAALILTREVAVSALRQWAAETRRSIQVDSLGKLKTAAQLGAIALLLLWASPLREDPRAEGLRDFGAARPLDVLALQLSLGGPTARRGAAAALQSSLGVGLLLLWTAAILGWLSVANYARATWHISPKEMTPRPAKLQTHGLLERRRSRTLI